ncbi:MAG TPA: hypothetical protein VN177_07230, partial [Myxococcales bacterium]|nr:hypothetical protein [Myxococcales bacterium]
MLLALWAIRVSPERRDGALVFLLQSILFPAVVGPVIWYAVDRRGRGLVLTAIRGGRDAAIEVRPQSGVGRGIVIPIGEASALARLYR